MSTRAAGSALKLADGALLRSDAYLDGRWVGADNELTFEVCNPADGEVLARVPRMGAAETRRAILAAERALPDWRSRTAADRARLLRRWADAMLDAKEDLAAIITAEQGKPIAESRVEVAYAASFLEWFGEEGKRAYGEVIPPHRDDTRIIVTRQPIGVTCGITPWNFPSAMPTRKFAPALAAGCTMVLKPAEQTPLSALAIAELGHRIGIPAGVLSVITGAAEDAPVIGEEMTSNPVVRKVGFTGSTAVGRLLMSQAAKTIKNVSLELGGNAPFIVFDDADLDLAVAGAVVCKFRNAGQTCISANRILVQDAVYEEFCTRFLAAAAELVVGPGADPSSQVGPLIDEAAVEKVERHIDDALHRGAQLRLGGGRHALGTTYFTPTVLVGVAADSQMCQEETFGPVAGIQRFSTEQDAIGLANDTPYGLASYLYCRDLNRALRVSEAIESGIVGLNTGLISTEVAPFGGVKESGIGREGGRHGLEEWLEVKYTCIGGVTS